jgi:hypothetical protein
MHLIPGLSLVLAAALTVFGLGSSVQDPTRPGQGVQGHAGHTSQSRSADRGTASTIAECMVTCEVCSHHCAMLAAQGKKEHAKTHEMLGDCAAICSVSASLAAHASELARLQLDACARACEQCATECEKHDDPMMKECAQSCRKCAAACKGTGASPGK